MPAPGRQLLEPAAIRVNHCDLSAAFHALARVVELGMKTIEERRKFGAPNAENHLVSSAALSTRPTDTFRVLVLIQRIRQTSRCSGRVHAESRATTFASEGLCPCSGNCLPPEGLNAGTEQYTRHTLNSWSDSG